MTHLSFRLKFFMAVFFIVMGLGTFSFMVTENLSLFDALYFNIVTMATVGYGDIHPTTAKGKILAIFIIILGTGTFLGVVANATEILKDLYEFLADKRKFLVDMLENPMLLEHEIFTDHLQAVFHLLEELSFRPEFAAIPLADKNHLAGDIKRVYSLLVPQWLTHMKYLKNNYPFLFSLAVRINPFNLKASATVNESVPAG